MVLLGELEPFPIEGIDVFWNEDICAANFSSRSYTPVRATFSSGRLTSLHSEYLHKVDTFGRQSIANDFTEGSTREDLGHMLSGCVVDRYDRLPYSPQLDSV